MRARFYSPEIKRFVNQDILLGEIFESQTLNRYAYVTGQPVFYIDPFGLSVGQPGFLEGFIPFWGSGRALIDDIQNENWGSATFNGVVLAVEVTGTGIVLKIISKAKRFSKSAKACEKIDAIENVTKADELLDIAKGSRWLGVDDLGIKGIARFEAHLEVSGDTVTIFLDKIRSSDKGSMGSFLKVMARLTQLARIEGAKTFKLKAVLANPRIREKLLRRYELLEEKYGVYTLLIF